MTQAESPAMAPLRQEASAAETYCFAHLSDPHLTTLDGVRVRELMNKRLLGYLSWRSKRRDEHRREVLEALVEELHCLRPVQLLVTGDLTHIGLPQEFTEAAAWLRHLGEPQRVMVVPGNHDCYVAAPWEATFAHWRDYLDGGGDGGLFPLLRRSGGLAFIGVSSARPTPPFFATGSVGRRQLERLERMLVETGRAGLIRVLLIHHPPLDGIVGWRKRLTDASLLRALLRKTGVELILHGHAHRTTEGFLATAAGPVPVLGVPSASAIGHKPGRRARYHLCHIHRGDAGCMLEMVVRGYDPGRGGFMELERRSLALPFAPVKEEG